MTKKLSLIILILNPLSLLHAVQAGNIKYCPPMQDETEINNFLRFVQAFFIFPVKEIYLEIISINAYLEVFRVLSQK